MVRLVFALLLVLVLGCGGSDTDPEPSAPDAGAAAADAGDKLPFMSPCEESAECETGLCFEYNAAGPHCTHTCESDLDCEDPSPGCNGMGVCKRPH